MFLILHEGRQQLVSSLEGYDGAQVIAQDVVEPPEFISAEELDQTGAAPLAKVEEWALNRIESDAESASLGQVQRLRRQVAISFLWQEVQRLKLMQATNNIPADPLERAKQLPFLSALVQQSGNTLSQVATAIENRLWDRVRRMAVAEAKLILGHDAVRSASTVQDKMTAATSIDWDLSAN